MATLLWPSLSPGSPIGRLYGKGTKATRGAATPRSMASVTVGIPLPSMASQTRPPARWQSGQEGVSRTASTPSSASLSATTGAVLSRSGPVSWMAPINEK